MEVLELWQKSASFIDSHSHCQLPQIVYDMEVGENRVRVFSGIEKREEERLEIYGRDINPCSSHRVSDL